MCMFRRLAVRSPSFAVRPTPRCPASRRGRVRTAPVSVALLAGALLAGGLSLLASPASAASSGGAESATETPEAVDPPAPANVIAVSRSRSLSVSWDAVAGATGYEVQYKRAAAPDRPATAGGGSAVGWVDAGHSGIGTSRTISGLVSGVPYEVRVRARSADGVSRWGLVVATPAADVWYSQQYVQYQEVSQPAPTPSQDPPPQPEAESPTETQTAEEESPTADLGSQTADVPADTEPTTASAPSADESPQGLAGAASSGTESGSETEAAAAQEQSSDLVTVEPAPPQDAQPQPQPQLQAQPPMHVPLEGTRISGKNPIWNQATDVIAVRGVTLNTPFPGDPDDVPRHNDRGPETTTHRYPGPPPD